MAVPVERVTSPAGATPPGDGSGTTDPGHYDVRVGAASYAPIVGGFGALCVPAVILVFTVPGGGTGGSGSTRVLAAGLLVLGMMGSLLGSIGLAALGGESKETANHVAAAFFFGVPVMVALVSVLGAFEVLAVAHLPGAAPVFLAFAGVTAAFGVVFNA